MAHPITRNCFLSTNKSNFLKIQCKKDSIKTQLKKQCAKQLSDRIKKSDIRAAQDFYILQNGIFAKSAAMIAPEIKFF